MKNYIVQKEEMELLKAQVHYALFQKELSQGMNPIVAVFPTNGLYQVSSLVREFQKSDLPTQDMGNYIKQMTVGNFCDMTGTLRLICRKNTDGK